MIITWFLFHVPMKWSGRNAARTITLTLGKEQLWGYLLVVLDYTTRTKSCRFCDSAKAMGKQPKAHDCRNNHEASSKAMEPAAAVELFNRAPDQSVKFSVYTGDDDSTTEAHIREKVTYEVEKTVTLYIWKDPSQHVYTTLVKMKNLTIVPLYLKRW